MSTLPNTDNDLRIAKLVKNGDSYAYESFPLLGWLLTYGVQAPLAITPLGPVQLANAPEFPAHVLYDGEKVLTDEGWINRAAFLELLP